MKDILTAPFVQEVCKITGNMYRLGWDERNGGHPNCPPDEKKGGAGKFCPLNWGFPC